MKIKKDCKYLKNLKGDIYILHCCGHKTMVLFFLNKWLERITYFCFNEDKNFFCLYCTDLEAELNQSVIKICVSESFMEQLASIESVPIKKCLCQNMI